MGLVYLLDTKTSLKIVRLKTKNGYGLYDMSGNVEDWCWDFYDLSNLSKVSFEGPSSPINFEDKPWSRVFRGGDYSSMDVYLLLYARDGYSEYVRDAGRGFRVVRTVTE